MTPTRVIGLGSPSGDDRIGWLAVRRLRRAAGPQPPHGLDFIVLDRPGTRLLEAMRGADAVVLADAVRSGAAPGTLHRLDAAALMRSRQALSSHDLGVAAAVALAEALGELPAALVLIGIEIGDGGTSRRLGTAVARQLPAMVDALRAELVRLDPAAAQPG